MNIVERFKVQSKGPSLRVYRWLCFLTCGEPQLDEKPEEQYVIPFKGAKLSKREANKIGLGLLLGFAGAMVSFLFG